MDIIDAIVFFAGLLIVLAIARALFDRHCPRCAKPVSRSASMCPYCQYSFPPPTPWFVRPPKSPKPMAVDEYRKWKTKHPAPSLDDEKSS